MSSSPPEFYESYWTEGQKWSPSAGGIGPDEAVLFERYLPPGTRCLDYGCGDARRYGKELAKRGIDYRGFDISATAVAKAQEQGVSVSQLTPDGQTSLESDSCDAAICFEVLEHLQEPDRALAEIFRVLKPGGHLLASVPNIAFFTTRLEFLLTGFFNPGGSPLTSRISPWKDPHIRFYHPALLRRLCESGGGRVVQLMGEKFSLMAMPYLYKQTAWAPLLQGLSKPVAWLGRVWPGMFSPRLFVVVEKPAAAVK